MHFVVFFAMDYRRGRQDVHVERKNKKHIDFVLFYRLGWDGPDWGAICRLGGGVGVYSNKE